MALSSNVRGTDGATTYKPANDRKILTSPSPAVPSGSKGIRFWSRYQRTSPSPVCLVYLACPVYLVCFVYLVGLI